MANINQGQSFPLPISYDESDINLHLSSLSFNLDDYLHNLSCSGSRSGPNPSTGAGGPGFLLVLSLERPVPHEEVEAFLTSVKEKIVLPS